MTVPIHVYRIFYGKADADAYNMAILESLPGFSTLKIKDVIDAPLTEDRMTQAHEKIIRSRTKCTNRVPKVLVVRPASLYLRLGNNCQSQPFFAARGHPR